MVNSVSVWWLAAACAQLSVQLASAQAPTQYNYPEFTGGYQAAGAAVNGLAQAQAQPGAYAAQAQAGAYAARAPATGPGHYNAAAVAAGYNYPEFTGGYPRRQQPQQPAYNPGPPPGAYNPGAYNPPAPAYNPPQPVYNPPQPAYNPPAAAYNPGAAAYNPAAAAYNPAAGYNGGPAYDDGGYNAGYQSEESGPAHYDYGYASDTSAKQEVRSPDGTVRGAYSYIDANGQTQKVEYVSDSTGFHVVSGTNLPQAPAPVPAQG